MKVGRGRLQAARLACPADRRVGQQLGFVRALTVSHTQNWGSALWKALEPECPGSQPAAQDTEPRPRGTLHLAFSDTCVTRTVVTSQTRRLHSLPCGDTKDGAPSFWGE